jgi:ABC-2 type transport system ATP-binding protein
VISIQGLSKQYGEVRAVDDLSFDVPAGKVTGFLGPNGAGKSTTMRIVMGLDRPTSGTTLVNGQRYVDLAEPLYQVGALLDAGAMHPGRTGRGHLRIGARTNGIAVKRVEEVIEQVGLGTAARRRIKGYSLGMRQRLGIAAALVSVIALMLVLPLLLAQLPYEWTAGLSARMPGSGALFLIFGEGPRDDMTTASARLTLGLWAVAVLVAGGLRLIRTDADR